MVLNQFLSLGDKVEDVLRVSITYLQKRSITRLLLKRGLTRNIDTLRRRNPQASGGHCKGLHIPIVSILGCFLTVVAGLDALAFLAGLGVLALVADLAAFAIVALLLNRVDKRVVMGEHNHDGDCDNAAERGSCA